MGLNLDLDPHKSSKPIRTRKQPHFVNVAFQQVRQNRNTLSAGYSKPPNEGILVKPVHPVKGGHERRGRSVALLLPQVTRSSVYIPDA